MRALLLVLACLCHARAETLVFLGDSITAGQGLSPDSAYPALIAARLRAEAPGWTVRNASVCGDTTAGGLRRVDWILRSRPTHVLVALGGNDGLRGIPPAETRRNLDTIVARLQAANVRVSLLGMRMPENMGSEYCRAFAAAYEDVAAQREIPLLPFLLEGVALVPALNQPDGIHPTSEGQRRIAEHVLAFLRPQFGGQP